MASSISQASGERFNEDISLSVRDYYGSTMTNVNSLIVEVKLEEIERRNFFHSMNGITFISCKNGIFNFTDLSVTSLPGSTVCKYIINFLDLLIASDFSAQPLRIEVPIR